MARIVDCGPCSYGDHDNHSGAHRGLDGILGGEVRSCAGDCRKRTAQPQFAWDLPEAFTEDLLDSADHSLDAVLGHADAPTDPAARVRGHDGAVWASYRGTWACITKQKPSGPWRFVVNTQSPLRLVSEDNGMDAPAAKERGPKSTFELAHEEALSSRDAMHGVVSDVLRSLERRAQATAAKELPPLRHSPTNK